MLDRLRQPEYTGENRCTPCTVVNGVLAAVFATAVGVWSLPAAGAFLTLAAASIYLRGYLVPGTPALTKQYFPDRVLRAFDKAPADGPADGAAPDGDRGDTEALLREAGAVEPCERVDDLCLAAEFGAAWHDRMDAVTTDDQRAVIGELLGRDPDVVSFESYDGDAFAALVEGDPAGQWESGAALRADVAAAGLLEDRLAAWEALSTAERSELLGSLRLFVDRCPACGGDVSLGEQTVSSCCRERQVAAVTCNDCGARLFEAPAA